ncbi:MAG: hypothetical protein ACFFBD_07250 [Candidatus Hodarchaeota archaeon]
MSGRKLVDLVGQHFGKLTVLKLSRTTPTYWLCQCKCGNEKAIRADSLKRGKSKSCGDCEKKLEEITKQMQKLEKKSKEFFSYFSPNLYEDFAEDHVKADALLCQALRILGYDILVDAFNEIEKRYN